jgi:hypothetical protein
MCRRIYKEFIHKEAVFRICCEDFAAVTEEIVRQRQILESYINSHPEFGSSASHLNRLAYWPMRRYPHKKWRMLPTVWARVRWPRSPGRWLNWPHKRGWMPGPMK